ncbi:MAG: hypothetical protein AB1753_07890 [Thermoproteota archaeon]
MKDSHYEKTKTLNRQRVAVAVVVARTTRGPTAARYRHSAPGECFSVSAYHG